MTLGVIVLTFLITSATFNSKDSPLLFFILYIAIHGQIVGNFTLMSSCFLVILSAIFYLISQKLTSRDLSITLFENYIITIFGLILIVLLIDFINPSKFGDVYTRYSLNVFPYSLLDSTLSIILPFVVAPFIPRVQRLPYLRVFLLLISLLMAFYLERRGPLLVILLMGVISLSGFFQRNMKYLTFVPFVFVGVLVISLSEILPEFIAANTEMIRSTQGSSNETRLFLYLYTFQNIQEFDFFQWLIGDYNMFEGIVDKVKYFHPHNMLLLLISGYGLIGILFFIGLVRSAIKRNDVNRLMFYSLLYLGLTESAFNNVGFYTFTIIFVITSLTRKNTVLYVK